MLFRSIRLSVLPVKSVTLQAVEFPNSPCGLSRVQQCECEWQMCIRDRKDSGQWITGVAHGKYMDMVPVGNLNGSSSTYYTDMYWISTATVRVVYRGCNSASADGGVSLRMRVAMLRVRTRLSARVWPSAAKSCGRKAWQRIRRYARWRKRKAPKRGAKMCIRDRC